MALRHPQNRGWPERTEGNQKTQKGMDVQVSQDKPIIEPWRDKYADRIERSRAHIDANPGGNFNPNQQTGLRARFTGK